MVIRFKLFCFFTIMAWASFINPKHGQVMIDAAQAGIGQGPIQW